MKQLIWTLWILVTLAIAGFYGYTLLRSDSKASMLIGESSYGHYQIELACSACHTDPFGGPEVIQDACESCHADELEAAHDSHPKKKFNDPRNTDLLEIINARYCISCHTEHQKEQTHSMGLSLPTDYCFHCHVDIGNERPSHKDLAFDTCASAGCHNFHDNRALYETFLVENSGGEWLASIATIKPANSAATQAPHVRDGQIEFPEKSMAHADINAAVLADAHGIAEVSCGGCHTGADNTWIEQPGLQQCQNCHQTEANGFLAGKHGMRLAQQLSPMSPSQSELDFKPNSAHVEQGCNSCHSAHQFDIETAATNSCLSCHNDSHSLAFETSPHAQLTNTEKTSSMSCASCHMPRVQQRVNGVIVTQVQHNQNDNLRPNEKMIRSVCMTCHNLEFSIDALADPALINNNFNGQPAHHIPSVDWALKREHDK